MILASDLSSAIRSALDAEGADHYDDNLDIIPAINASVKWVVSVINYGLGEDKYNEEIFRDLTYTSVFRTSINSRIGLNKFPYNVWTILSVNPYPELTIDTTAPVTPTPNNYESYYLPEYVVNKLGSSCKRLSIEEWGKNMSNPFEAGYTGSDICAELIQPAYLNPINYKVIGTTTIQKEIEIRPELVNKKVAIVYVKEPTVITSLSQQIEFPAEIFNVLLNKALQYISYKQGDGTNLFTVTQKDLSLLLKVV